MDASAQVADFISRLSLLSARQPVIVGVSGGADSLCLLDCLHRLRYPLVLAHLDHQLRPESGKEASFCRALAARYRIPAVIESADVRAAASGGHSLEEASRLLRYRFLARAARQHGASVIATGHTADDQVETILMHFLRGSGPSGLRGMLPSTALDDWVDVPQGQGVVLIRPLLELTRTQTVAHCRVHGFEPVLDSSNMDPAFFRNRLRHDLLPELETYNPGIRSVLLRTGSVMSAIAELEEDLVEMAWPQVAAPAGDRALLLGVGKLLGRPLALQRALLRRALRRMNPHLRDVSFDDVSQGLDFIASGAAGRRQSVTGDLELLHMGDEVLLWQPGSEVSLVRYPQMRKRRPHVLKVPGRLKLAHGWQLVLAKGNLTAAGLEGLLRDAGAEHAFLDADCLRGDLRARTLEPGDRVQPLGMRGRIKVAELFVNEGIPHPARASWPLVEDAGQIVWVAGVRIAHGARLTRKTSRYVELSLVRPEGEA